MLLEDIITRHEQDGPGPLYDNNSNSINIVVHELEEAEKAMGNMSDLIKAQIANHTLYQYLVSAYIDCRKVIFFVIVSFTVFMHSNWYLFFSHVCLHYCV